MKKAGIAVTARRVESFDRAGSQEGDAAAAGSAIAARSLAVGSFMQSDFWAVFKSRTGWRAYECNIEEESGGDTLYALVRSMKGGLAFCYVPHGPASIPPDVFPQDYLEALAVGIRAAIREKIFFIRFDLSWETGEHAAVGLTAEIDSKRCRLARGTPVQVPDTVILSLEPSCEELLAAMKPKWRYNIRLAEKKGVEVKREGAEALPAFQKLYLETARRDGISIHADSYYRILFDTAAEYAAAGRDKKLDLSVWTASHEGQPLASIITLFFGKHATYLYGASSDEKRNLMPAYALQWQAIQAAREAGCTDYDFFGIPPDDNPDDPMAGLYFFKTGFGGTIVHRTGCVDYPLMPFVYKAFRLGEKIRLFWYKKVRKDLSGHKRTRKNIQEKNRSRS
ncbi:MAG: peptidoglycan bridge formation glycyltransferase FemA/FemB family protein [Spirochaetaceae bacterium]|nr:peptidoglycan bridge formation glycyltransferase FemA/FemB family protein [Spirochaetaceae bacterium]